MNSLLASYIFLPIIYIMYRAGELAAERKQNAVLWRIYAYLITLTVGVSLSAISGLLLYFISNSISKRVLIWTIVIIFMLCALGSGLVLLARLKKKKMLPQPKRQYRPYDFKNAFLFPRRIPRGGFIWRILVYLILINLSSLLITLPLLLIGNESLAKLPWPALITIVAIVLYTLIGVMCFGMLYYICYICIPRIRDAGLTKDALILLFIPGISTVALLILLVTPSNHSSKSSI